VASGGAAPAHGNTGGGSPELGSPGASMHQTLWGLAQNGEGIEAIQTWGSNLLARQRLRHMMVVRLLRAWVMMAARSGAPPASRNGREASPRGPHPPPRLQSRRPVVNLLCTMRVRVLGFVVLRIKIGANLSPMYRGFGTNS
jgi:hypothetical protein